MTIGGAAAMQQGDAAENVIALNLTEWHIGDKPATLDQEQQEQRGGKHLGRTVAATRRRSVRIHFVTAWAD